MAKLIRIKPFNPRRGYVLQRYVYQGVKFEVDRGWYRVPDDMAAYLATIHADDLNPDSPLAFDVLTEEEARAAEAAEKRAKLEAGTPAGAADVTNIPSVATKADILAPRAAQPAPSTTPAAARPAPVMPKRRTSPAPSNS